MSDAERRGVLQATDGFPIGGLERIVVGLARELADRGVAVTVLADADGAMWQHVPSTAAGIRIPASPLRPLRRLLALRRAAVSGRFALIHAHQRGVALLARIAAAGTGVVVVEHVHNVFRPTAAARLLSFRGHLLIACATPIGRMLVERFQRPAARVRVVPNGVDDPGARPRVPHPGLRIVGAGRMTPQKDPVRFVRVVAALAARRPAGSVTAIWLGDGPLMPEVRAARAALGLEAVLQLPGVVADPAARFEAADVLLSTSRHEGLPLVALEALAVGRGLVLPDVGGCADAVDESTGLLYSPELTDDALAAVLDAALTESALAGWAAHARPRYERAFTFERMADAVLRLYAEATGRVQGDRVQSDRVQPA